MLGFYENFPRYVQFYARFATSVSNKRLQQTLIQVLHKMNGETLSLDAFSKPSIPQCTAIFEFGIAEGDSFNYLDVEETNKVLESMRKKPLQLMDLFCAIRYYKTEGEGRNPLKFDYYMLRLIFGDGTMEVRVFHERGPRHVLPEDLINLIAEKVNEPFSKKVLKLI
ncbi:MAG: hypothetical protein ACPLKQ_02495 [Candidatus Bathyarchaeales archaeon]